MKLLIASGLALAVLTGGAFAADLIVDEPAVAAPAPTSSWDGAYIGANFGYGWANADSGDTGDGAFGDTTDIDLDGFSLGGQIGYNYTLSGDVVIGLEGDLNWNNQSGTVSFPIDGYEATDTINYSGALTGHIGLALDSVMPYVLAGVAFANNTVSYYDTDLDADISDETQNHVGYTVGVGIAAKLSDSISAFAEYRYADYGSQDYANDTGPVSLTSSAVRAGVNFHF